MNKKRIAQYCCAALVAAGVGLNIQNAIADYGIAENSLSLVAVGGSNSGSNSNSNSGNLPDISDTNPGNDPDGYYIREEVIPVSYCIYGIAYRKLLWHIPGVGQGKGQFDADGCFHHSIIYNPISCPPGGGYDCTPDPIPEINFVFL